MKRVCHCHRALYILCMYILSLSLSKLKASEKISMRVYIYIYNYICIYIYIYLHLSISPSLHISISPSIHPSMYPCPYYLSWWPATIQCQLASAETSFTAPSRHARRTPQIWIFPFPGGSEDHKKNSWKHDKIPKQIRTWVMDFMVKKTHIRKSKNSPKIDQLRKPVWILTAVLRNCGALKEWTCISGIATYTKMKNINKPSQTGITCTVIQLGGSSTISTFWPEATSMTSDSTPWSSHTPWDQRSPPLCSSELHPAALPRSISPRWRAWNSRDRWGASLLWEMEGILFAYA